MRYLDERMLAEEENPELAEQEKAMMEAMQEEARIRIQEREESRRRPRAKDDDDDFDGDEYDVEIEYTP